MRLYAYIILCGIIIGWGTYEHNRFLTVRTEYSEFKESSVEQTLKQEKEHAIQVNNAMSERDAALNRLRDSQRSAHALQSSLATAISRGTCKDSTTTDAALSQFFTEVEGYITEGDTAIISDKTWLESWPK